MNSLHSADLKVQTSGGKPDTRGQEGLLHSLAVQCRKHLGWGGIKEAEVRREEPVMLNSIHMCASPHVSFT